MRRWRLVRLPKHVHDGSGPCPARGCMIGVPRSQAEKVAFRKAWDERVRRGQVG